MNKTQGLAIESKNVGAVNISPVSGDEYKLVFIDDFNGDKLDDSVWSIVEQNANSSEGQANKKENIALKDSKLVITGKVEKATCIDKFCGRTYEKDFTGGRIDTMGKKSFMYGRIEAYCKLPFGKGIWPAFWTIGDSELGGSKSWWPWGGEIDILEMFGKSDEETALSGGIFYYPPQDYENFDYSKAKSLSKSDGALTNKFHSSKFSDDFHLYGIEWTEDKLVFYFDDEVWGSIDISGYDFTHAMHNPHIIILNFAMEGFGLIKDSPNKDRKYDGREPDKNGVWPKEFLVDWVKVWQK